MARFLHISQENPETGRGGVAQFARDLKRAIGDDLEFAHFEDYGRTGDGPPWVWSQRFTTDPGWDAIIADGYFGLWLQDRADRIISVCHSTWLGWMRDIMANPYPGFRQDAAWILEAAQAQEEAYREADLVVAVSPSSQEELWDLYQIESTMIHNCVDLDLFRPKDHDGPKRIAQVANGNLTKGWDMIEALSDEFEIESLGFEGERHDRWHDVELLFLPSRHEAVPYAAMEAMACLVPVVAYRTGMFRNCSWGQWVTADYSEIAFRRLIRDCLESDILPDKRGFMEDKMSFEQFERKWRGILYARDTAN